MFCIIFIKFICNSKNCLSFWFSVSKIKPHTKDKNAANIIMLETTKVGNFGTKPVCKYSANTGMNIAKANNAKIKLMLPKNFKGL